MKTYCITSWRSLLAGSFLALLFLGLASLVGAGPPTDDANRTRRPNDTGLGKGVSKPVNVCPKCQPIEITRLEPGFKGQQLRRVKIGEKMSCPGCSRAVEIRSGTAVGESAHNCIRFASDQPPCCAALFSGATPAAKPELPKTGVNLSRPAGGWLNVEVVGHQFVVSFFDGEKKPVSVEAVRGVVRYVYTAKENKPPVPLNRSADGQKLVSPAKIRSPHVFHVHLVLIGGSANETSESHVFRYP